jgi:hypothetical protein
MLLYEVKRSTVHGLSRYWSKPDFPSRPIWPWPLDPIIIRGYLLVMTNFNTMFEVPRHSIVIDRKPNGLQTVR